MEGCVCTFLRIKPPEKYHFARHLSTVRAEYRHRGTHIFLRMKSECECKKWRMFNAYWCSVECVLPLNLSFTFFVQCDREPSRNVSHRTISNWGVLVYFLTSACRTSPFILAVRCVGILEKDNVLLPIQQLCVFFIQRVIKFLKSSRLGHFNRYQNMFMRIVC